MANEKTRLENVKPGQRCRIVEIELKGGEGKRLIDFGFIRGATVEVVRNAPFADPVEVLLYRALVSLRHDEAKKISVEVL
jgi:Fe2+ transport system protein FeoA